MLPFNKGSEGKRVVNLGTGTSFNVSSYEGYKNFTANNFIVGASKGNSPVGSASKHTCRPKAGGFTISKTYTASTGVLKITGNTQTAGTIDDTSDSWLQTVSQTMTCFAYLIY